MKRRIFILWLSSVFAIFLIVACIVGYGVLRLLPAYQSSIEGVLSKVTGSHVSLKVEYASWHGINPVIQVRDVKVKDKGFSLNIPKMTVHINAWQSLMSWHFLTNDVVIDAPKLTFYSSHKGFDDSMLQSLSVTEIDGIGRRWSSILGYLLQQKNLDLNNMQVDILRNKKLLADLTVHASYEQRSLVNGVLRLTLQLQKKRNMQTQLGQINIVSVIEKKGDQYYFDSTLDDQYNILSTLIDSVTQQLKISHLIDHQLTLSVVSSAKGLDSVMVMGELSKAQFKTNQLDDSAFRDIVFNLRLFRYQDRFVLGANPLSFVTNNKRYTFRSALFSLDKHRLVMNIPRLNLADFSSLVQMEKSDWRKNIMLSGVLSNVRFSFDLRDFNLNGMQLAAHFNDLGIANSDQNIDFKGLSGNVWWQQNHVKLAINSPRFDIAENHIFSRDWPELAVKGNIDIIRKDTMVHFAVDDLVLTNNNIHFVSKGSIDVPLADPKNFRLDLKGELNGRNLTTEYQAFLPQKGIPKPLYDWLMQCLYGARKLDANFAIKGIARDIPYPKNDGVFKIDAAIKDASLSPYFGLGVAHQVTGILHFDNEIFTGKVNSGSLAGIPISNVDLMIDNITPEVPATFNIDADVDTNSQKAYAYLAQTKYHALAQKISQYAQYQGDINTHLNIAIALEDHTKKDSFSAKVELRNGIVDIKKPHTNQLYDVNADLLINNKMLSIKRFTGFWDINMPFNASGVVDVTEFANPTINLHGGMSIAFLPKLGMQPSTGIDCFMQGVLPFGFMIKGNINEGVLQVHSNLLGLQNSLGAPLTKKSFEYTPLLLKSTWQKNHSESKTASWYISSKLHIKHQDKLSTSLNINTGGVISDVSLYGQLSTINSQLILNVMQSINNSHILNQANQAWQQSLQLDAPLADQQLSQAGCFAVANYNDCVYRQLNQQLQPKVMLNIDQLNLFGTDYRNVTLQTNKAHNYTNYIAQDNQKRSLIMSVPDVLNEPIEISVDNLFFALSQRTNKAKSNDLMVVLNTLLASNILRKTPDMNVKFTNLQLGGYSIPNFLMATTIRGGSLSIPVLSIYDPNSKLLARLVLSPYGSYVHANVFSLNWGNMLHNFGYDNFLKGGAGNVQLELSWPGLVPSTSNVSGKATADLLNGVVLSIDSGIAKYIGLLSLDSYFKRLFMPYDDFEHRGMAFNSIIGAYGLANGLATSNPSVIIDTPSFALVVTGDVNLTNKQLNQRIKYQPHFSGTTAAVAGAIGGPIAAFATYLGSKLLGNTVFKNIGLVSFDVTGSWDKPILKQVQ
ncbi:YhdP family phospholipid transporter [Cysteiniphilum halobium]|uniref:YhdP family phospholipid transporter n=1 Tax=Cysteiniphilum halobium TaxID=2219059 RepID=UPI000E652EAE|nr:AsmA-like C-terminal region-containing protein [Cysteiniphilum halobium]